MNRHHTTRGALAGAALLGSLTLAAMLGGCEQRALFIDSDPAMDKIRYTRDGESAVATRERRKAQTEMGFGMSQGAAPQ